MHLCLQEVNAPHQHRYPHIKIRTDTTNAIRFPFSEVVICCEADEQWSFVVRAILTDSSMRMTVFESGILLMSLSPRYVLTLQRILALRIKFNIVLYKTDAWPVYQTLLDSAHHINIPNA
ncbi:MAG: IS1 family transposase [Plesiomonas shigelloides]